MRLKKKNQAFITKEYKLHPDGGGGGGVLPIMAHTGMLRPKGVPLLGVRYKKERRFH